jgi:molybdenum cofactor cytidylyltransferase
MTIAFTGAGGKTSAMRRLAEEQSRLLMTTTTRLGVGQSDLAAHQLIEPTRQDLQEIPALLEQHGNLLVTGPEHEGKWTEVNAETLHALKQAARSLQVPLAIEADGARGRSLKAPAEHEPAIPAFADLVIPTAGLDALGQQIDSEAVHRSKQVAALLASEGDEILEPHSIARIVTSLGGGLKGVPEAAEVRVLLTRATELRLAQGRAVAAQALKTPRIQAAILAELDKQDGVREAHGRVAGVVLAAGGSSRLGQSKQLIEWRGRPLVWHAVQASKRLEPIVVVVGEAAAEVREALVAEPVEIVENSDWEHGQSSSVRVGLSAVEATSEAAIFLLADMPFVGSDLISALVERHRQTLAPLVAPWAGGRRANPVLFDRSTFADLRGLSGDRGGRALFRRYEREFVAWDETILMDIDKPADLEKLRDLE